jgi:hypothetical protein
VNDNVHLDGHRYAIQPGRLILPLPNRIERRWDEQRIPPNQLHFGHIALRVNHAVNDNVTLRSHISCQNRVPWLDFIDNAGRLNFASHSVRPAMGWRFRRRRGNHATHITENSLSLLLATYRPPLSPLESNILHTPTT